MIGVVVAGLVMSQIAPHRVSAVTRLQGRAFWQLATYILNGTLFLLVGLQVYSVVRDQGGHDLRSALADAAIVIGVVIGVRIVQSYTLVYVIRALDRRPVIVGTLVIQGLTLVPVVRWARIPEDATEQDEIRLSEKQMGEAAHAAIAGEAARLRSTPEVVDRLLRMYGDKHRDDADQFNELRLAVLAVKRAELVRRLGTVAAGRAGVL